MGESEKGTQDAPQGVFHPPGSGESHSQPVEVGFLNEVMGAKTPEAAARVVEGAIGAVAEALQDQGLTNAVRRKLLNVAESRLGLLERVLDDPMMDSEKRARLLLKALEIGIRVPSASIEGEGEGRTLRLRVGGGG